MITIEPSAKLLWITEKSDVKIRQIKKVFGQVSTSKLYSNLYASFHVTIDRGTAFDLVNIVHNCITTDLIQLQFDQSKGTDCEFIKESFTEEQERKWFMSNQVANDHYIALLRDRVDSKIASTVLPNSLKTDLIITGSFHDWLTWLNLPEFKKVKKDIATILLNKAPKIFKVGDSNG